jgi:hypothetical protein
LDSIEAWLESLEDDGPKPEVDPKKLGYALRQEQKARKAMLTELGELRMKFLKAAGFNNFHCETFLKYFDAVSDVNIAAYRKKAGLPRKRSVQ